MLTFLKTLFSDSAAKVVDSTMKGIDNLFTSDDERLAARTIIEKQLQDYNLKLIDKINHEAEQVTIRHKTDMTSDSWLSKNIRPLTLMFILGLYTFFSLGSGNIGGFEVKGEFVELLGTWGMVIMCFYFGGRSFEKVTKIVKGKE